MNTTEYWWYWVNSYYVVGVWVQFLPIKRTQKEHQALFISRCERLADVSCRPEYKNFAHCNTQLSKIPPFCMSYHNGRRYEGLNSKQFLITTIAWSILMEWNCGMQVTGFIIIHNNNIGCISVNVSALKNAKTSFPLTQKPSALINWT